MEAPWVGDGDATHQEDELYHRIYIFYQIP